MNQWRVFGVLGLLFVVMISFQNCGGADVGFVNEPSEATRTSLGNGLEDGGTLESNGPDSPETPNIEDPIAPVIGGFGNPDEPTAPIPGEGLKGKIYYFLNDSGSEERPSEVKDKFGNSIPFPNGLSGVDQLINNGIQLPTDIVLSEVFFPTLSFTSGFKDSAGNLVKDLAGNPLFEAFAIDVSGTLKLGENMEAGEYEVALISDDGSLLSIDGDNNGSFENLLVNNDGNHSTKMGCTLQKISMNLGQKVPIRIKYYQGPRTHIALTLVMRKLEAGVDAGMDPLCGVSSTDSWFNFSSEIGYVPDLVNSDYGELVSRGWMSPTAEMYK